MSTPTTTLKVTFVSESAGYDNTFGWYNSRTGMGGILFADVEQEGSHAPLTPGVSTATFTVNTADLQYIQYFLVSDGYDLNQNDADDLTGAVKVIQLADGTWAVADVDSHGNVITEHGKQDVLQGAGAPALFTETSKNAGHVDYASSVVGSNQTAATLAGDTADGPTGQIAWEDLVATKDKHGNYGAPGDADYNDAVFNISIVGGNHAPVANADSANVSEDAGATTISVLANDTDPDAGNTLHVTSVATAGLLGTVTIAAGGASISYTPAASFQSLAAGETATETFSYTVADQDGLTSSANVTVTVVGANDAPKVAAAVAGSGNEGSGNFTVNLLAGASDVDHGAVLHVGNLVWTDTGNGLPAGFTASGNTIVVDTNNLAYDAMGQGETFVTHFSYDVIDEHGALVHQTATVTIVGTNDGPIAVADINTGDPVVESGVAVGGNTAFAGDPSAVGNVLANDTDVDHSDTRSVTSIGDFTGTYGTLHLNSNGTYTYTLNNADSDTNALAQGESASDVFGYTIADSHGATASSTLTINITGTNDRPVISEAQGSPSTIGSVKEDTGNGQVTGQLHAVDPDHGATQTWTVVGGTASGNADYHFLADSFTVTKGAGAGLITVLQDDFSDGNPPPNSPPLNPGQSNQQNTTYAGIGSFTESGGKLHLDSNNAVAFVGVGTPDPFIGEDAIVKTNIDPTNTQLGLKQNSTFDVSGVFDLILPDSPREEYGIRLTDRLIGGPGTPPDQPGNDVIELVVRENLSGSVVVALRRLDFAADVTTNLQSITLNAPAGTDQIRLHLNHAANASTVTASFDYLQNGVVVGSQTFLNTPSIFNGENWTRAEIVADAPATSDSTLSGTFGTLNINQSGAWTYALDNSRTVTQNLAEGQHATDTFTVKVADQFGATDTRTINVDVVGTNDAPVMQTQSVSRALSEDQSAPNLTATGLAQFSDADLTDAHSVSAALQSSTLSSGTLPPGVAALLANAMTASLTDPATGDGHGELQWGFALANSAVQFLGQGQTLTLHYNVTVIDSFGAAATQDVAITITGTNDIPAIGSPTVADVTQDLGADGSGNLTAVGTISILDADGGQSSFQTGVISANGNLGSLSLQADGSYTYTVADSAVQYLGAADTKVDTFTVTSFDGTQKQVSFTIHGINDAAVIGDPDPSVTIVAGNLGDQSVGVFAGNGSGGFSPAATYGTGGPNPFVAIGDVTGDGIADIVTANDGVFYSSTGSSVSILAGDGHGGFLPPITVATGNATEKSIALGDVTGDGVLDIVDANSTSSTADVITGDGHGGFTLLGTFQTGGDVPDSVALGDVTGDGILDLVTANSHSNDVSVLAGDGHGGFGTASVFSVNALGPNDVDLADLNGDGRLDIVTSDQLSDSFSVLLNDGAGGFSPAVTTAFGNAVGNTPSLALGDVNGDGFVDVVSADSYYGALSVFAGDGHGNFTKTGTFDAGQGFTPTDIKLGDVNGDGALDIVTANYQSNNVNVVLGDGHGNFGAPITLGGVNSPWSVALQPGSQTNVTEGQNVNGAGNLTSSGMLPISDVDQNQSSFQTTVLSASGNLGSLNLRANGSYTYTVADSAVVSLGSGDTKVDTFTVTSLDGTQKQVSFTIHGVDNASVASAISTDANEDTGNPVTLTASYTNAGGAHTFSVDTAGTHGHVVDNGNGTFSYDPNGAFEYLAAGETTIDTFQYTVSDSHGGNSTATATVTIHGENDAPAASALAGDANENTGNAVTLTASYADGDLNDSHTFSVDTTGTLGSVVNNGDGTFSYNSNGAFESLAAGETTTDTFHYTVSDGHGGSSTAAATVTIHGENDAATITGTASGSVVEAGGVNNGTPGIPTASGSLTVHDADHGQAAFQTPASLAGAYGAFTFDATTGLWGYTLSNGAANVQALSSASVVHDSLTVKSLDGTATQTIDVTIQGANDAPTVAGASTGSVTEDVPSALQSRGNLTLSDPDGGTPAWSIVGGTTSAQTQDFRFQVDNLKVVKNGGVFFEDTFGDGAPPPSGPNFPPATGVNSSAYSLNGTFTEAAGRAFFDGPQAVTIGTATGERALLLSDISPLSDPTNGPKGLKSDSDFVTEARFDLITPEDGGDAYGVRLTDTNSAVNNSTADLVVLRDATGVHVALREINIGTSVTTTLESINLTPPPNSQIVLRLSYDHTSYVDSANGGSVTASFDIVTNGVVVSTTSFTNHATIFQGEDFTRVQLVGQAGQAETGVYKLAGTYGTLTVAQDGQWHYFLADQQANVQALTQGQTVTDTFTVRVSDGLGGVTDKQVVVTVTGANEAAVIGNPTVADVTEDVAVNAGNLTASGTISISDVDGPASFQTTVTKFPAAIGDLTLAANGSYTYSVANSAVQFLGAGQTKTDTFTITAADGTQKNVVFTIHGANDAPIAQADTNSSPVIEAGVVANSDTPIVGSPLAGGNVLLNDTDPDIIDNPSLFVSGVAAGTVGTALSGNFAAGGTYGVLTISVNGIWSYQLDNSDPDTNALVQGQAVSDVFSYTVVDGHGASANQTITVNITGTNDAPIVSPLLDLEVLKGTGNHQLDLLTDARDPEGNSFTITNIHWLEVPTSPYPPGFTLNPDGHSFTIDTNAAAFNGLTTGAIFDLNVAYDLVDSFGAVSHQIATTRLVGNDVVGGHEFQVNTYTDNLQYGPSTTALTDGGFVVTWSSRGQDGSGDGIYGQRYDADGTTVGSEFQINTYTADFQASPSTVGLANGGFVVSWWSQGQDGGAAIDGSARGVYAQVYDAHGAPVGGEFQVNTYINGPQELPSVAALGDGSFVDTWSSYGQDGSIWGVYGKHYDANGNAISGEFQINTYTPEVQTDVSTAGLAGGGYVVTWMSLAFSSSANGQDGSGAGVFGQLYDANDQRIGGEFRINSFTAGDQKYPTVASLTDGGFVVTWASAGQDGDGFGIYAQRYDSAGTAAGGEFQVNTFTANDQHSPSITGLADGGFVVMWTSVGEDGDGSGVYGQRYDAAGAASGGEFRINESTAGNQAVDGEVGKYALDQLNNGEVVASWYGAPSISGDETYARIFSLDANDETLTIHNGFTFDLNVAHKGAVQFEGPTGTLKFETTNFTGTVDNFVTNADHIDFSPITGGNASVVGVMSGDTLAAHSIGWVTSGADTILYVNASNHSESIAVGAIDPTDMTVHLQNVAQLHVGDFIV